MRTITTRWKTFAAIALAALAFGASVDAAAAPNRHAGAHRYDARHHRHHRVVHHRRHHPVHHRVATRAY